jgi:hypothetical protein
MMEERNASGIKKIYLNLKKTLIFDSPGLTPI